MIYLLMHVSENDAWRLKRSWIDKWAGMHGMSVIIVDPSASRPKTNGASPIVVRSILEAQVQPQLRELQWIYLDERGHILLDEFEHPSDDAIYCLGDDRRGFGCCRGRLLPGFWVRVRPPGSHFAAIVAPMVCYDRTIYVEGRRR